MKKNIYVLGLLALTVVTSCKDNSYDWDNRDMTLEFSKETVWLPDGSTDDAKLENLFSIDPGQNLKYIVDPETGRDKMYCYEGDGEHETDVNVPTGSMIWTDAINVGTTSTTVELGELPDFLRNPGTCFDIKNPVILLRIDKTAGVDFRTRLRMVSVKDGQDGKIAETNDNGELTLVGDCSGLKSKKFYIAAESVPDEYLPEEFSGAKWVKLRSTGMGPHRTIQELVKDLPDEFRIELIDYQGKTATVAGASSDITIDYLFYAPMRPDVNFALNDNDIADGINNDIKDIMFNEFVVNTDITGDLPLVIRLEPKAVDENGIVMNELEVVVNKKDFVEVPGDKTTNLDILIRAKDGGSMSRYTKRDFNYFDGIFFDFTVKDPSTPGEKIFADMKIKLTNMKMGVKGLGYDAN